MKYGLEVVDAVIMLYTTSFGGGNITELVGRDILLYTEVLDDHLPDTVSLDPSPRRAVMC